MASKNPLDSTIKQSSKGGLTICMLASGSKGNATYVSDGTTSILFDAGLSGIEVQRRLSSAGLCIENLDAIIVSHEHDDHIRGVGVLSRRFDLPVYVSSKTRKAAKLLGKISKIEHFKCGSGFCINGLNIHPFSISHDAKDPAGFTVKLNGSKVGIATDLGVATSMVKEHLKGCSVLILEANHDPTMLAQGPYPWPLKQRIKGRTGHLSNMEARELLSEIKHSKLEKVILAHLSEENNTPQKALSEVGLALNGCNAGLSVATQDRCTGPVHTGCNGNISNE
jgi:phosphoribosyl 1,2-cyclic phosphodiesterase